MARFSNGIIRMHTVAMASAVDLLAQNIDIAENPNMQSPDSGYAFAVLHRMLQQAPVATWETESIKKVLANVGILGKCVTSDGTHPGVQAFCQKHDSCAATGRTAGSTHKRTTFGSGHIVLSNVTGNSGAKAVANMMMHATSSDGSTAPQVDVYNVALPAQPTDDGYVIYQPRVCGLYITGVIRVEVIYNLQYEKPIYAGSIWPKLVDPQRAITLVRIVTEDIDQFASGNALGYLNGATATHANSHVAWRHQSADGGLDPIATTSHIITTMSGSVFFNQSYQAQGIQAATAAIEILGFDDGTNVPLVTTVDQALTALS